MVALEAESVRCALIDTILVGQQVSEWIKHAEDGAAHHNLLLDTLGLLCEAHIHDPVIVILLSALALVQVILGALTLLARARIARLRHKAFSFSPGQHFVNRAARAASVNVAVNDLLMRESHPLLVAMLTDAILGG